MLNYFNNLQAGEDWKSTRKYVEGEVLAGDFLQTKELGLPSDDWTRIN
jgi:hypothetical protein